MPNLPGSPEPRGGPRRTLAHPGSGGSTSPEHEMRAVSTSPDVSKRLRTSSAIFRPFSEVAFMSSSHATGEKTTRQTAGGGTQGVGSAGRCANRRSASSVDARCVPADANNESPPTFGRSLSLTIATSAATRLRRSSPRRRTAERRTCFGSLVNVATTTAYIVVFPAAGPGHHAHPGWRAASSTARTTADALARDSSYS